MHHRQSRESALKYRLPHKIFYLDEVVIVSPDTCVHCWSAPADFWASFLPSKARSASVYSTALRGAISRVCLTGLSFSISLSLSLQGFLSALSPILSSPLLSSPLLSSQDPIHLGSNLFLILPPPELVHARSYSPWNLPLVPASCTSYPLSTFSALGNVIVHCEPNRPKVSHIPCANAGAS